jgi:hypothetical protein
VPALWHVRPADFSIYGGRLRSLTARRLTLRHQAKREMGKKSCIGGKYVGNGCRRCRQPTFRTHALLVEPASRAPKNLGESKASTNNPMAACAPERNGMHSNNKRPVPACLSASALSMKTFCSCCCRGKSFCCCYCCCRGSSICCCYFSSRGCLH